MGAHRPDIPGMTSAGGDAVAALTMGKTTQLMQPLEKVIVAGARSPEVEQKRCLDSLGADFLDLLPSVL